MGGLEGFGAEEWNDLYEFSGKNILHGVKGKKQGDQLDITII